MTRSARFGFAPRNVVVDLEVRHRAADRSRVTLFKMSIYARSGRSGHDGGGPRSAVRCEGPTSGESACVATLADAILERLVHRAYQINLKGESMRKRRATLTQTSHRGS